VEPYPWLLIYYHAFHDLIGDRHWEYGPITWMARQGWADKYDLDDLQTELLHVHVKAMDLAFLQWKRQNKPPSGTGGS